MYRDIQDGITDGSKKIDDANSTEVIIINGWTNTRNEVIVHHDYIARAFSARIGLYMATIQMNHYIFTAGMILTAIFWTASTTTL